MPDATPLPVSGRRFAIANGGSRAVIGSVAAVLCELRVDGRRLTETVPLDQLPPQGCGMVLAPWPNRVRDGRWSVDGQTLQLDVTEPSTGNASHGLLRNTAYRLIEKTDAAVELGALVAPQHGWPFALETRVRYEALPDGLSVTHRVTNVGDETAPWAVGAHPYLRLGETPIDELRIVVAARSRLTLDAQSIPVGSETLDGTEGDLRVARRLGDVDLNTAYGELSPGPDGTVAWLENDEGERTVLRADDAFRWLQVYTPRDHPTALGPRLAIAIEPMTAPPDALNSGTALIELAPGASWSGSWSIRHESEAA